MFEKNREELFTACKEACESGLVTGSSGNGSFIHNDEIYITATGTDLATLTPRDLAVVAKDGTVVDGVPSKELSAHRAIYNHHPDIGAVLHIHGEYIAAYTCIREPGNDDYPAIGAATPLKVADRIPLLPYSHTNTLGDYELFEKAARKSPIFFQCNHGVFIGAKTAKEAIGKAINLETNMRVYFIARSTGARVNVLTQEQKTVLANRAYETNLDKRHIDY